MILVQHAQQQLGAQGPLLRLLLAALAGGLVGLERGVRGGDAGIRTHVLVGLGSALFTLVGIAGAGHGAIDPTRIAAQVVNGIGWLGAAVIVRRPAGRLTGLTSAATLWTVAALGMAAANGLYALTALSLTITLIANGPLRRVSRRVSGSAPAATAGRVVVRLASRDARAAVLTTLHGLGLKVQSVATIGTRTFAYSVAAGSPFDGDRVLEALNAEAAVEDVSVE